MTAPEKRNMAASVRTRLTKLARATRKDFQRLLLRYIVERFLYRLERSGNAGDFLLKGAMLFAVREDWPYRSTRDLDLHGLGATSAVALGGTIRDLCTTQVQDDGVQFDAESVKVEPIRGTHIEGGFRVVVKAAIEQARIRLQIDVGFGGIVPLPEWIEVPSLLGFPSARIQAYPNEAVIAEKTQAFLNLGETNSRVKDYFDIWILSRTHSFDGNSLASSLAAVFRAQRTRVPADCPAGLTDDFAKSREAMWQGFLKRAEISEEVPDLQNVMRQVRAFLLLPLEAVREEKPFRLKWPPGGPWQPKARDKNA